MRKYIFLLLILYSTLVSSQEKIPFTDMSFWKANEKTNWQIVGDVTAELGQKDSFRSTAGTGILANLPSKTNRANLVSANEYGDIDVSFDFMMAVHSNSGFYLMGRYEIQLLDSWGVKTPTTGDCGGIYKRRRFENEKAILYEGHAPRQNACLAPGLWQHIDISFQAPRFDASGKKTANAKYLKIVLNGVLLHENVELTGPTGGPISETEAATGPFMIQGDHGPVAFRNMTITNYDGQKVTAGPVNYAVYYGKFKTPKDFLSKTPDATGTIEKLTWEVSSQPNDFAQIFKTTLSVPKAGKHILTFQIAGMYSASANGKEILTDGWGQTNSQRKATAVLPAGEVPLEITVYKTDGWLAPITGLWIESTNFRQTPLHSLGSMLAGTPNDPINLDANEPTVFRSFMDFSKNNTIKKRIVHAVNVGNPDKLHYTYDLDNGTLAQLWKGDFLYTSPMWDNRGDGSSRPRGANLLLNDFPTLCTEGSKFDSAFVSPAEAQYKISGYDLDKDNLPTFHYTTYGAEVNDQIRITEGKYFSRILTIKNGNTPLISRLAVGKDIVKVAEDTYAVDGKSYYIKAKGASIEKKGNTVALFAPVKDKLEYAIMF
jgi:hypothetical protein